MRQRKAVAFTLVELLVVVAIIALLAGLLVPTLAKALEQSRRASCANNTRAIAKACFAYAQTPSLHRVAGDPSARARQVANALPFWAPTSGILAIPDNTQCLWLLVETRLASPGLFLCPSDRQAVETSPTSSGFTTRGLCYSFQSMLDRGGDGRPPALSIDNVPGNMILVADKSPRVTFTDTVNSRVNSRNHGDRAPNENYFGGGPGQNVGRMDGSAGWFDAPTVTGKAYPPPPPPPADDWIFQATDADNLANQSACDIAGKAATDTDVFLLP